jgi:hypothetical protein
MHIHTARPMYDSFRDASRNLGLCDRCSYASCAGCPDHRRSRQEGPTPVYGVMIANAPNSLGGASRCLTHDTNGCCSSLLLTWELLSRKRQMGAPAQNIDSACLDLSPKRGPRRPMLRHAGSPMKLLLFICSAAPVLVALSPLYCVAQQTVSAVPLPPVFLHRSQAEAYNYCVMYCEGNSAQCQRACATGPANPQSALANCLLFCATQHLSCRGGCSAALLARPNKPQPACDSPDDNYSWELDSDTAECSLKDSARKPSAHHDHQDSDCD